MTHLKSTMAMVALAMVILGTSAQASLFLIDFGSNMGAAPGWDVFTFPSSAGPTLLTDRAGSGDNDVTLTISTDDVLGIGQGGSGAPGTSAIYDTINVPKEARDDYIYVGSGTGSALVEIKNLDAGTYSVTVFEGRTTDSGQYGKIWGGSLADEPSSDNTGNFTGASATISVSLAAGQSLFYRHLEDNMGGTSGLMVRKLTSLFLIDLGGQAVAAGWDVVAFAASPSIGPMTLADRYGSGDNDVTLTITPSNSTLGQGSAGAPGTSATYDTITVPAEVRNDYMYVGSGTGSALFEIQNLNAGSYNVTVFEGRTTDTAGQFGKIWGGSLADEPSADNTGNFAGTSATIAVSLTAGQSLFYRHHEDNAGGTSGLMVREMTLTPPKITAQPQSRNANQGFDATFSVTASGTEPLHYYWYFNTNTPVGADASTLLLTGVQPNQAGTYSVVVSNEVGIVPSDFAVLTVDTNKVFLIDFGSAAGAAGDWDVLSFPTYPSPGTPSPFGPVLLTDRTGSGDNDVTLTITTDNSAGIGQAFFGASGTAAIHDTITVPSEARDDYLYVEGGTGTALVEINSLEPGAYSVTVFEGRTTDANGQAGKIWGGAVADEPVAENTGNFAGSSATLAVLITAGQSLFYRHMEDNYGGTAGLIIRMLGDSDGDGIPDTYEIANGLNPSVDDSQLDLDGDGSSNLAEFQRGTKANNPDTDGDGLGDGVETGTGTYVDANNTGTDPLKADTDNDGLSDGVETNTGTFVNDTNTGTNPFVADTDGDGFSDGVEVLAGFNPTQAASTPEGVSTIRTAVEFEFYAAPGVSYRIEASTNFQDWTTVEPTIIGTGNLVSRLYSTKNQPVRFYRAVRN